MCWLTEKDGSGSFLFPGSWWDRQEAQEEEEMQGEQGDRRGGPGDGGTYRGGQRARERTTREARDVRQEEDEDRAGQLEVRKALAILERDEEERAGRKEARKAMPSLEREEDEDRERGDGTAVTELGRDGGPEQEEEDSRPERHAKRCARTKIKACVATPPRGTNRATAIMPYTRRPSRYGSNTGQGRGGKRGNPTLVTCTRQYSRRGTAP